MSNPPPYELNELVTLLEIIGKEGNGPLNIPKALYTICIEIQNLKDWRESKSIDIF